MKPALPVFKKYIFPLLVCVFICSNSFSQAGRFKRIDYTYDLVSNKVKEVSYQKDSIDQFIHKYNYDADNRITEVHTSTDGVIWDRDAGYSYYQHGPLSRIEIGDNKVQGIDYVYTLQGWIKSVNSNTLDATRDVGKDGLSISTGSGGGRVARDAYGYSLGYYSKNYKDYKPIGVSSDFIADITGSALDADNTSLYNGNIRHMVTALGQKQANGTPLQVQASVYRYDQLNSLKQVNVYALPSNSNSWASAVPNASYHEAFTYDENGNIQTLQRNGSQSQAMDALTYNYTSAGGKKINNKLLQVNDNVASNAYSTDIDDQGIFSDKDASTQNYGYDEIGNLIRDKQEGIASIEWTAAGKVRKITRAAGSTMPDLEFAYDGMGHRILKIEKPAGQGTAAWIITYYVHDATGNVLAVYKKSGGATMLQEQSLYGTGRLGMITRNVDMSGASPSLAKTNFQRTLGKKQYELTNHLGNVLTTVSDRKLQHNSGGTVDYYTADILSATDYYAFGSPMPERDITSDDYRYGFNGMEKDNEVKGKGNSYTTEFRQYDPRLGRWLSLDPKSSEYPFSSPYNSYNNDPVYFKDPLGNDPPYGEESCSDCVTEKDGIKTITAPNGSLHDVGNASGILSSSGKEEVYGSHFARGVWAYQNSEGQQFLWDNTNSKYVLNTSDRGPGQNAFPIFGKMGTTYAGGFNPKEGNGSGKDDQSQPPLNKADVGGFVHDQKYDALKLVGEEGTVDPKSGPANQELILDMTKVYVDFVMNRPDPNTGEKVSFHTAQTAVVIAIAFTFIEYVEKPFIEEIQKPAIKAYQENVVKPIENLDNNIRQLYSVPPQ